MACSTQVQFRRGNTADNAGFTGAVGEVTYDTQTHRLFTHDGVTVGGFQLALFSDIPPSTSFLSEGTNLYYTDARTRLALSVSGPLNYNNGTGAFSITLADGTHDGYLSQTDWGTFNSKQAALGFTPENVANKTNDTTLGADSATLYPTEHAVKTYVDSATTGGPFLPLTGGTLSGLLDFSGATNPGIRLNNLTTTQRNALAALAGELIWNTTTSQVEAYNGAAWNNPATGAFLPLSGGTLTGLLSFSGTGHVGLKLNNLTSTQRNAAPAADGNFIFNTTTAHVEYESLGAYHAMVNLDGDTMTGTLNVGPGAGIGHTFNTGGSAVLSNGNISIDGAGNTDFLGIVSVTGFGIILNPDSSASFGNGSIIFSATGDGTFANGKFSIDTVGNTLVDGIISFSNITNAGLRLNNLTTTQRNAIAGPLAGELVWNTTDVAVNVYDGAAWTTISGGGGTTLPVIDTTAIVKGSADATKLLRFEVDGFTTATTRVVTPPNADITLAGINIAQTFAATQTVTPAANTQAIVASGYSLTGANTQSLLDLSGTWNTSGSPSGIALTITNTASGANARLLILNVSGTGEVFAVNPDGSLRVASNSITVGSGSVLTATNISISSPGTILTNGNVLFNSTSVAGLRLNNLTTAQRDLVATSAGQLVWNTDTKQMNQYDGTAWTAPTPVPSSERVFAYQTFR